MTTSEKHLSASEKHLSASEKHLSIRKVNGKKAFRITEQTHRGFAFGDGRFDFRASNGIVLISALHSTATVANTVYVRGSGFKDDHCIEYSSNKQFRRIKKAVREYGIRFCTNVREWLRLEYGDAVASQYIVNCENCNSSRLADFGAPDGIETAFIWQETPEGVQYWYKINKKWRKHVKEEIAKSVERKHRTSTSKCRKCGRFTSNGAKYCEKHNTGSKLVAFIVMAMIFAMVYFVLKYL